MTFTVLQTADAAMVPTPPPGIPGAPGSLSAGFDSVAQAAAYNGYPTSQHFVRVAGYAAAGDGGGALYIRGTAAPSHPGYFQSADGIYWIIAERQIDPRMLGAVWDGVHDDTTQNINATLVAQAIGAELVLPRQTTKITAPWTVSAGVRIRGGGIQGDAAGGYPRNPGVAYTPHGVTQTTGYRGTAIVCGNHNGIVVSTDDAVTLQDFELVYPSQPSAGVTAIIVQPNQATATVPHGNSQTTIRGVMTTGADVALRLTDCLEFTIADCHFLYNWTGGILCNNPSFASYQQATIYGCEFWGAGQPSFSYHIMLQAGGDLRIVNNKLNGGFTNTNAIAIFGATGSLSSNNEPMVISGNSIEGPQNGITFNSSNPNQSASQIVITGNQIWAGYRAILANVNTSMPSQATATGTIPHAPWIFGLVISGNSLVTNGIDSHDNVTNTGPIVSLDGVDGAVITSNHFGHVNRGAVNQAVNIGTSCARIRKYGNSFDYNIPADSVASPAMPATGVGAYNTFPETVQALIFGQAISSVWINGAARIDYSALGLTATNATVLLNNGDVLQVYYAGACYMNWLSAAP